MVAYVRFQHGDLVLDRLVIRFHLLAASLWRVKLRDEEEHSWHPIRFRSIGAYTKDTIVTRSGTRYVDGGGYSYPRMRTPRRVSVGAVTRSPQKSQVERSAAQRGRRSHRARVATLTLMRLEYPTTRRRAHPTSRRCGSVRAGDSPRSKGCDSDQPVDSRRSSALRVEAVRAKAGRVGLDVQGSCASAPRTASSLRGLAEIRRCRSRRRAEVGRVEGEFLTASATECYRAQACELGPKRCSHAQDGLVVSETERLMRNRFCRRSWRGRSGRGDTCVGSYCRAAERRACRRDRLGPPP